MAVGILGCMCTLFLPKNWKHIEKNFLWNTHCPPELEVSDDGSVSYVVSESMIPSNHLILCRPLLFLPSIFPSIRVFSNESALRIRWTKYWNFSFNISPTNEHPGLISFRMDWLDLLAVQGTLKSLLQHHSSKASILWCSSFFIVQLSHPYMTTGKTIALTRWTFVDKVMSLLFMQSALPMLNQLIFVVWVITGMWWKKIHGYKFHSNKYFTLQKNEKS